MTNQGIGKLNGLCECGSAVIVFYNYWICNLWMHGRTQLCVLCASCSKAISIVVKLLLELVQLMLADGGTNCVEAMRSQAACRLGVKDTIKLDWSIFSCGCYCTLWLCSGCDCLPGIFCCIGTAKLVCTVSEVFRHNFHICYSGCHLWHQKVPRKPGSFDNMLIETLYPCALWKPSSWCHMKIRAHCGLWSALYWVSFHDDIVTWRSRDTAFFFFL